MPTITFKEIIEDLIKYTISEDCKQPQLQDESICCLTDYSGCCCRCSYQLPIYVEFPISYIFCYVCLSNIQNKIYLGTTHGYCKHFNDKRTCEPISKTKL